MSRASDDIPWTFEFQPEELKTFGELTPLQVDRLLTRGWL